MLLSLVFLGSLKDIIQLCGADPTDGFIDVPLTEYNFELQKPYDVPLEKRYSSVNGVRRLWVYADDKPHNPSSQTQPRTEVRIRVTSPYLRYSLFITYMYWYIFMFIFGELIKSIFD